MNRLVLFDIDQTLISTGGAGSKAMLIAIEQTLGISRAKIDSVRASFAGKTDPQVIQEIVTACGYSATGNGKFEHSVKAILAAYLRLLPEYITNAQDYFVHEGVSEILDFLHKDNDSALGLLTGNLEAGARLKLERVKLNHFFPIGSFGSDSSSRLDLPAIAHQRAQTFYRTEFTPNQIIIIGDAENDVLCAKHYGAISIAVTTGKTTKEQLSKHNPNYIFPSLKNTKQIMQAILASERTNKND